MRPSACLLLLAVLLSPAASAAPPACRIPGMKVHWIADYCMAQLETDDEIAASTCIGDELERAFADGCAAKLHYKRAMCERAIALRYRQGEVDDCLADREFVGATVRRGGVGGL
ncbi:MAG: hypothetical protein U1A72_04655 [Sulfuritalea sp.]|nr:hypothetical protein [Sulfuritalea sp.]